MKILSRKNKDERITFYYRDLIAGHIFNDFLVLKFLNEIEFGHSS